jgi:GNAT superfamily N-acetyltransferase
MIDRTLRIVQITGSHREILEGEWLAKAEQVHRQLRPQLPADYLQKMTRIFAKGGEMCVAVSDQQVVGVAVFREFENTHVGRRFYIDDLVTDESRRSSGAGKQLIAYLERFAQDRGCSGVELESGTHRARAHRFYFREGFLISSFSFRKEFQ